MCSTLGKDFRKWQPLWQICLSYAYRASASPDPLVLGEEENKIEIQCITPYENLICKNVSPPDL
jgi:hypothetical protein